MIIPSTSEAGPIVLLEAMASGLVPVCSVVGFAGVVVDNDHSGLLIKNGSDADYATAIARLADDPALLDRLSANAIHAAQRLPQHATFARIHAMFEGRSPSRERHDVVSVRALQVPRGPKRRLSWLPNTLRGPIGRAYRFVIGSLRPTRLSE